MVVEFEELRGIAVEEEIISRFDVHGCSVDFSFAQIYFGDEFPAVFYSCSLFFGSLYCHLPAAAPSARLYPCGLMILKRYVKEAYMIFRLLSKVETNKIYYSTFVVRKVTIQILYKLWKDEYLHIEVAHLE